MGVKPLCSYAVHHGHQRENWILHFALMLLGKAWANHFFPQLGKIVGQIVLLALVGI